MDTNQKSHKKLQNSGPLQLKGLDNNALANYKGEFFGEPDNKYQDPVTGAHFKYEDMYLRLYVLQQEQMQDPVYVSLVEENSNDTQQVLHTEGPDNYAAIEEGEMGQFLFRTQENRGQPIHEATKPIIVSGVNNISKKNFRGTQRSTTILTVTIPENMRHNRQISCPNYQQRTDTHQYKAAVASQPKKTYVATLSNTNSQKTKLPVKASIKLIPKQDKQIEENNLLTGNSIHKDKLFETVGMFTSMYFFRL